MGALDRSELRLWAASSVVVLALHAAGATALLTWHEPNSFGVPSDAIAVDLAPYSPPSDTVDDITPGPKQEEETPQPPPKQEKVEEKLEEKIDVPPSPTPAVAPLPPPEPVDPKPSEPTPALVPPAPATTAPPRPHASKAQVESWYGHIVTQIERNKSYPPAARAHGQKGVVDLAFSIDREGHVISGRIVKSSGYVALDQETLATLRRAQPFPLPPTGLDGEKFDFAVPVKFNIR
ncbi:MAG TPA: energy transducer TonB [Xanthobacteraceae bacterium]|jgi:protein TonB